jgi:Fe(3+) dicitrate transport protein
LATLFLPAVAQAANSADTTVKLKEVVVTAKTFVQDAAPLPEIEGAKIYAGKKTSAIQLDAAPAIVNNNYRHTLAKTPGLLLSEETTPLFSVGYRGLNPDRAQFMQVMKDGIPIQADIFGYPEAYYVPPLQVVDRIEFIRGGSALLYGPQPGGALNYVTRSPYDGPFRIETENSAGSFNLFSHYTSLSGQEGDLGHYSYFHHRQAQGFRDFNSQYEVWYGGTKIVYDVDDTARWIFGIDLYNEEHGEPGGLTRAAFDVNPDQSTRLVDHFELNRYAASAVYEKEISDRTAIDWKLYVAQYERLSWRQRGGGFGTLPAGATAGTNDIQDQRFYNAGTELRLKHEYDGLGREGHALTAGVMYYHTTSPRIEERGTTADALSGDLRKDSDRSLNYISLFMENLFRFGALKITPGVRLENIWQSIEENVNLDKTTTPLADESNHDFVPLFGIGAEYEWAPDLVLYANASQSYRPAVFSESVPLGTNQTINADLEEGESWQTEAGLRGRPCSYFSWDASVFHMSFDNQIGTLGSTVANVGEAGYDGAELFAEFGGDLSVYGAITYLDASFEAGPSSQKTPAYAPDYLFRAGVEYRFEDRAKARLGATFSDDHYSEDANIEARSIPSYAVWDLTAEAKLWRENVSVFGGINNLFDEQYFSRVTAAGIDPAAPRNYYGGVRVVW